MIAIRHGMGLGLIALFGCSLTPASVERSTVASSRAATDASAVTAAAPEDGSCADGAGRAASTGAEPAGSLEASQPSAATQPVNVARVLPAFPARAGRRRVEAGWVRVAFVVDRTGRVRAPRVVASEPFDIFDDAALEAVRKWHYRPAQQDGEPVRQSRTVKLVFVPAQDDW